MESLRSRLVAVRPVIQEIMAVSCAVGLSYGVVQQGEVVHVDNFGYSDKEKKLPVDIKTMFPTCSLTKGMVTSMLGQLADQGKLDWNAKVKDVLPSFAPQAAHLREEATVIDLLSIRSRMERHNIWHQSDNRMAFEKKDSMRLINSFTSATGLREQVAYNNWSYEVASHIIKEASGKEWDDLLKEKILDSLSLTRTDASGDRDAFDNFTNAYMVLDSGEPVQVPISVQSGRTLMGAAGGVVSCVDDLLTLYGVMLKACIHQFESGLTSTPDNPFKQLATTMSAHTILPGAGFRESTYGMGWIRTQLPNQMCKISPNFGMVGTAPIIGEGASPKLLIFHYGSMPGSSAGVVLFPETESIIVVLINTTARCHLADWMAQFLTQTIFNFPKKHDYLGWVSRTVQAELQWHARISKELEKSRKPGTSHRNLEEYVGTYANSVNTFTIEIRGDGNALCVAFEGRDDEVFSMQHYQHDTFSWLQPRDDLVRRARTVQQDLSYYLIRFENNGDRIDRLFWTHDSQIPRGEQYNKI